MRLAAPLATFAFAAALLAGCGSSGEETSTGPGPAAAPKDGTKPPAGASVRTCALAAGGTVRLRATEVSCGEAQRVALAWRRHSACAAAPGASHSSCSVAGYRCLATATDRGLSVGCARPGRSIAFTSRR